MTTLQITFVSEDAGYRNTLGWYNKRTGEAGIVFLNTNDDGAHPAITAGTTATVDVAQADIDSGDFGFFLIADGASNYGTGPSSVFNGPLSFSTSGNGDGVIRDADGHKLTGEQGQIIFTDQTLNKRNVDYTSDGSGQSAAAIGADQADGIIGRIAFEDLVRHSDRDFNDLVIDVAVVGQANRPPEVDDQAFSVAENAAAGTLVGQVAASDPDAGQVLSYSITDGNANGAFAIDASTGAITVADPSKLDFENPQLDSYALTIEVRDDGADALTDTAVVAIAITNVNEAPTAGNDVLAAGATEDMALVISAASLLANDADPEGGVSHTIVAVGGATNGSVALNGDGDVVFTPTSGFSGAASFSYTMSDGAHSSSANVSLNVSADADTPALAVADASSEGDGAIALSVASAINDGDGSESLSITIAGVPDGWTLSAGTLDPDSGDYFLNPGQLAGLSITPPAGTVGTVTLTVTATATEASNGDAASASANLAVSVTQAATLHGQAIDGYIHGATVFADADLDGVLDAGEARSTTDTNGAFVLVGGSGPLVMFGGTDVSTGQAFAGVLRAPEGSTVVTPLTTLVAELVDQGQTLTTATNNVAAAFGLEELRVSGNLINLLTFDPVATAVAGGANGDAAVQVLAAGIQVQNAIAQIGSLLEGAGATDAGAAVISELASLVSSGSPVDLANAGTAETLINAAANTAGGVEPANIAAVAADAATVVAAANEEVDQAAAGGSGVAVLEDLAQVAVIAQGDTVASDLAQAGSANDPGTIASDYTGSSLQTLVDSAPVGDVDGSVAATPGDDVLIGTAGNDVIDGLAGNDLIIGLGGNDQLFGSDGKDTLRGGAGNDVLNGGILADFQSYAGFLDIDTSDYSTAASGANVNLSTGAAADGDGGSDTLIGIERVIGSSFNDVLIGSAAFSEFYVGGAGNDTIDGGLSYDRAEYTGAAGGITVNMTAINASSGTVTGDSSVGADTLIGVEQIVGTAYSDTYIATGYVSASAPGGLNQTYNEFEGADGNDVITGNGNTRIGFRTALEGINVDLGAGVAVGGASVGTDTFTGVSSVRGSPFADLLTGSAGLAANNFFESFEGRGGNDVISGGAGFDLARYGYDGAATTGIVVNMAAGTVVGDPAVTGTDTLSSIESIQGSYLDDTYNAVGYTAGSLGTFNEFEGMAGNDTITGNGNTRVSYTSAREAVSVNLATGVAVGGASVGTDTFTGVTEARGSNFDDTLTGSNNGIAFTQFFEGRGGDDIISGGGGFDQARYSSDFTAAGINVDMAAINAFTGTVSGDVAIGTDKLINIASVRGTNFADTYVATGFSSSVTGLGTFNEFEGGGGNDTITGNGNTRLTYINSAASVSVNLGLGTATGAATGTDTLVNLFNVRGSNFNDTLIGSTGNDIFEGRGGDDFFDGLAGGFDRAIYNFVNAPGSFIFDSAGVATATVGGQGVDTLVNIELIRGTLANDLYDATLFSGDTRFEGDGGNDTVLGNGHTLLEFGNASAAVVVDLQAGTASGAATGTDTISGVSFVLGSNLGDTITGSGNDEIFVGRGGNDLIDGAGGRDEAQYDQAGGAGNFIINGSGQIAASSGGQGSDTLTGIESVIGTGFNDTYDASAYVGVNEFEGIGGNDAIIGNGQTRINFWRANSGVTVDMQAGTASGSSSGNDTFTGVNFVSGTDLADTFVGSTGEEDILGHDGNDLFMGSAGSDTLDGGNGTDRADYSASTGAISVDLAAETATDGMGGFDVLRQIDDVVGSSFNDTLTGDFRDNILEAGAGQDSLRGSFGNDVLNGGVIADFQSFVGFSDIDQADYSAVLEAVNVNLSTGVAQDGNDGTDTLIGIERVIGSAYDDVFTGSGTFVEFYVGGAGNDTIDGGLFNDRAEYSAATGGIAVNMTAYGDSSGSVVGDASVGTDTLIGIEQVMGSNFADTYVATGFLSPSAPGGVNVNFNEFQGLGGNDTITGNGGTRITYQNALESVNVNLATGIAVGGASVGTDSFTGVNLARGSAFADTLTGGLAANNGFEGFEGRGGNDTISGGSGFDQAGYAYDGPVTFGITVNLAAGTVIGDPVFSGTDTLSSVESIRGSYLGDSFNAVGFSGASTNAGSNGTFNEFEGMAGNDTITGNGNTRISYISAREAVDVNLAAGLATGGASVGTDSFSGVSDVRGSHFADTLTGSNNNVATVQIFEGRGGDDVINGGGGFDRASYSSDFTSTGITVNMAAINAFTGTVTGDAQIGIDTLIDVASVRGTSFADVYDATGFSSVATTLGTFNEFEGGGGNDLITGNGNTRLSFTSAGSGVTVDLGAGTASGATTGGDTFTGVNAVRGSNFNDTLTGSGGNETFEGVGGDDTIDGLGGFDLARYERFATGGGTFVFDAAGEVTATTANQGVDTLANIESIRATDFADTLDASAFAGSVTFAALAGDDTLVGGGGADALNGGDGNDTLIGGDGNDTLQGDDGDDSIDGVTGTDLAQYNTATGSGSFIVGPTGIITASAGGQGTDTLFNIDAVVGTNFADTYDASAFSGANTFEGIGGNDTVLGNGQTRIDFWRASSGVTVDLLAGTANGASTGTDTLSGVNWASGSNFNDLLTGSAADELFHGHDGDDVIEAGDGNDYLEGGNGVDRLTGGAGFDYLRASGSGTDTFDFNAIGEAGDTVDQFTAGAGGDVFDIADLLDASTTFADGAGGAIGDYAQVVASGGDGLLQIDTDGAGGAGWQTLATILGGNALDFNALLAAGNVDIIS